MMRTRGWNGAKAMASWAIEHLTNGVVDLLVAIVATWLWNKYQPMLSDYYAQKSASTKQRQVAKLQKRLEECENRFNDSKIYLARLIVMAMFVLLGAIVALAGMTISSTTEVLLFIYAIGAPKGAETISFLSEVLPPLGLGTAAMVVSTAISFKLTTESHPNNYKENLRRRIARLRGEG
jgi:hypothetical protein